MQHVTNIEKFFLLFWGFILALEKNICWLIQHIYSFSFNIIKHFQY